eukprot:scaffold443_cov125-Cylindrotheca_fusiformis.AAC.18
MNHILVGNVFPQRKGRIKYLAQIMTASMFLSTDYSLSEHLNRIYRCHFDVYAAVPMWTTWLKSSNFGGACYFAMVRKPPTASCEWLDY